MKDYFVRVAISFSVLALVVVTVLLTIGAVILWIKIGDWIIPVDITYRELRQVAYVVVSLMIIGSLVAALNKDNFE